ncbi:hypothetical protein D9757_012944 [Collybiopsis confluens]|uniref:Uncharacterized protein n=1 Tax=Collybiopsis confluens TaxID=2823264 RepID=A0A8H5D541_9AGAR|nr:hypothetical protein D9757_012944 [Collybiopsis confluens]
MTRFTYNEAIPDWLQELAGLVFSLDLQYEHQDESVTWESFNLFAAGIPSQPLDPEQGSSHSSLPGNISINPEDGQPYPESTGHEFGLGIVDFRISKSLHGLEKGAGNKDMLTIPSSNAVRKLFLRREDNIKDYLRKAADRQSALHPFRQGRPTLRGCIVTNSNIEVYELETHLSQAAVAHNCATYHFDNNNGGGKMLWNLLRKNAEAWI